MRIAVIGAGPAGLAFAIVQAQAAPGDEIVVFERRTPDAPLGWGVTLRDGAFAALGMADLLDGPALEGRALWYRGTRVIDLPNPDAGHLVTMARGDLVRALRERARSLGVALRFEFQAEMVDPSAYDLVVGADGAASAVRKRFEQAFRPEVREGDNVFAWLATTQRFPKLSILLRDDAVPLLAWAYRYAEDRSTLIIEVSKETFAGCGLAAATPAQIADRLRTELDGHEVHGLDGMSWRRFPTVRCARLFHEHVVLIGDAAHTTHFSQGFGTLFALDDALVLAEALTTTPALPDALASYEAVQQPKIEAHQATCTQSMRWSETVTRALDRRDEAAVQTLIDARWPGNTVSPAPLDRR